MTTAYDLELLDWVSAQMDMAASVARVRTLLAAMPDCAQRNDLIRLAAARHEEIITQVKDHLADYLTGCGEESRSQSVRRRS